MYQNRVRELLSKVGIDVNEIDNDTDLLTSGALESLGLIALICFMEEDFSISLDSSAFNINNFRTINALCLLIGKYKNGH